MAYIKRTAGTFNDSINFINFNQDFTCISVGTKNGYNLFNCDPFGKCFAKIDGGIGIVEMLFSTSLVAVVGVGDQPHLSPRRLKIVNTKRKINICELTFPTAVLKVKLNRKRLIVVLEEQIYIYDISNMELLYTIETSPNPQAICALSPSSDNCYLAYPSPAPQSSSPFTFPAHSPGPMNLASPNRAGDVAIFDTISLQPITIIEAHRSALSAISFNNNGTLLATASDKGTIVRVFSVPTATKLYQFRRGTYPSRIFSINFNLESTLLAVSSATETVHIFKLVKAGNSSTSQYPTTYSERTYDNNVSKGKFGSKGSGKPLANGAEEWTAESPDSLTNQHDAGSGTYGDDEETNSPVLPELVNHEAPVSSLDADSKPRPGDSKSSSKGIRSSIVSGGGMASILRRGSLSLGKHVAGAVGTYLPTAMTEMWEPQRDFAFVKLSNGNVGARGDNGTGKATGGDSNIGSSGPTAGAGLKTVVAFNSDSTRLLLVTGDGYFYQYKIDLDKGGECKIVQQYSLFDNSDD